jgi:hypothetical protein
MMDFTTALLAIAVLKPMRRRWLELTERTRAEMPEQEPEWTALSTNS